MNESNNSIVFKFRNNNSKNKDIYFNGGIIPIDESFEKDYFIYDNKEEKEEIIKSLEDGSFLEDNIYPFLEELFDEYCDDNDIDYDEYYSYLKKSKKYIYQKLFLKEIIVTYKNKTFSIDPFEFEKHWLKDYHYFDYEKFAQGRDLIELIKEREANNSNISQGNSSTQEINSSETTNFYKYIWVGMISILLLIIIF